MIAWRISEVKDFMAKLLLKETFDRYLVTEAEITTLQTVRIQGRVRREWFDNDEEAQLYPEGYIYWRDLKSLAYQMVKGRKTPLFMKLVFRLPKEILEPFLEAAGTGVSPSDVDGLFWNLHYERSGLIVTSGVSMRMFTLDKTLEQAFDSWTADYFKAQGIVAETI